MLAISSLKVHSLAVLLKAPFPVDLSNFLRELIHGISRLSQSCHLPEFTDHGLSHLCSLVDRISRWSMPSESSSDEQYVVEQESFTSGQAAVLWNANP